MQIKPAVGQTLRQDRAQRRFEGGKIAEGNITIANRCGEVVPWSKINRHRGGRFPVRRNLQNGWPTETTMRKQHLFTEALLANCRDYLRRNAGQIAVALAILSVQQQRYQRRPRLYNRQPELARQFVAE